MPHIEDMYTEDSVQEPKPLTSSSVQEIVSANPGFIVRHGTVIILAILLLLLGCTWFIRYPDTVNAPAKLTTINAPKPVVVRTSGKLVHLSVADGAQVHEGDIIGSLESVADAAEVLRLSSNLDTSARLLDQNDYTRLATLSDNNYTRLGEIQQAYQTFVQAYVQFRNYTSNGLFIRKRAMLQGDIARLQAARNILSQQENLYRQDLSLSKSTYDANEKLVKDKVISQQEYREISSQLIGKKLSLPQIQTASINNEAQQNDKQKEILELDNQIASQKITFQEALNNMKSQAEDWKKKYLLTAPVTGKVTFTSFLQENQQLQNNQTLAYVTPPNSSYYMQLAIPQSNFGKVSPGQKVLLKFPSYQWQEYGNVEGIIDYISPIPSDSGYIARISLPNGLNTNHKKTIPYREGLIAQADIVTKDMRLLQRFYYNIVKSMSR
ncbi:HlyD family secretion protein [Chitinophagaceae bacterium MMS25-I14]